MSNTQWFFITIIPLLPLDEDTLDRLREKYPCVSYIDGKLEIWLKTTPSKLPTIAYEISHLLHGIRVAHISGVNTPKQPLILEGTYNRNLTITEEKTIIFNENTTLTLECNHSLKECIEKILNTPQLNLIEAKRKNNKITIKTRTNKKTSIETILEKCIKIKNPVKIPP